MKSTQSFLVWKEYKGIKYADSNNGFFWLIYPSGLKGQFVGKNEDELIRKIDALKIAG